MVGGRHQKAERNAMMSKDRAALATEVMGNQQDFLLRHRQPNRKRLFNFVRWATEPTDSGRKQ